MRTLIRIIPEVEKANEAIANGTFERLLEETMERLRPEAAYFFAEGGRRSANLICDLIDQADIPSIAEPWFMEVNATVEFFPCMNAEDVQRGLAKARENMKTPVGV